MFALKTRFACERQSYLLVHRLPARLLHRSDDTQLLPMKPYNPLKGKIDTRVIAPVSAIIIITALLYLGLMHGEPFSNV